MKIEITKAQLQAIINARDDMNAMLGTADDDNPWKKNIRLINRMLIKNNII